MKHPRWYNIRGFQSHTTQTFANVYYLAISVALKTGHHQATVLTLWRLTTYIWVVPHR